MKVVIDSYAWLNKSDLGSEKLEALRRVLTIAPRKVGDHPGEAPKPIKLYSENAATIGIPRQYFLSQRKPNHQVEFRTTEGDRLNWPGPVKFSGKLWPEQEEAKNRLLAVLRGGSLGGLVRAHTAWGKTVWTCALISELKMPALVVVHKEFLMNQWRERIGQYLPNASVGTVQGPVCDFKGRHIVLGMLQSLADKDYGEEFRNWPGILISDECHRIAAGTWSVVPTYFPARIRLGLSATIRRKDGADNVFYYHIGNILFASKEQKLKPKVRRVWTKFDLVKTPYFNPSLATKNQILKALCANTARNTIIIDQLILAVKAGRKVLVLSERLQHLDDMEALLYKRWNSSDGARPSVGFYVGGCTEDELEIAEGCQVIFATSQLVQEGLDIPALDTIFLTCPMSDVEQAVGRILRVHPTKKDPVVVDFRDDAVPKCVKAAKYRDQFYSRVA